MKFGNITSFGIKIGEDGNFYTEKSRLVSKDISKVFRGEEAEIIHSIVTGLEEEFDRLHKVLEDSLSTNSSIPKV